MQFSFSSISDRKYLRPWAIYKGVRFGGISDVIVGDVWRAWDFEFTCDDGVYTERIFQPRADDARRVREDGDRKTVLPSEFERILYFVAQLLEAYVPDSRESFNDYCALHINGIKDTSKQFDLFISELRKLLSSSDRAVELLLVGRRSDDRVFAALPRFIRINKDGEIYVSERFIGNGLSFTPYERHQADEYHSIKPTVMEAPIKDFEELL